MQLDKASHLFLFKNYIQAMIIDNHCLFYRCKF